MNRKLVAGGSLVAGSLALGALAQGGLLRAYDVPLFKAVAFTRVTPDWLIATLQFVTRLGDPGVRSWFVLAALCVLIYRRCWRSAIVFLATVALAIFSYSAMKEGFGRARPTLVPWLDDPGNLSYPSGHAAGSMVVLLLGTLLIGRPALVWAAVLLSASIGLSRVFLGVHWPSDVVGGWAFGAGSALIGYGIARSVEVRPSREQRA